MVDLETKPVRPSGAEPRSGRTGPLSGFAGQAAEVTSDLLELAELQVKLARLDAADAVNRVVWPAGMLLFAVCIAIASLPVGFLGLAGLIEQATGLEQWQAQLIVGVVGVIVAVVTATLALRTMTTALSTFQRSAQELAKNIAWFKTIFRKS